MTFSILILTFNEAANLPACLDSVAWADDIAVLASFSTDETVAIASDKGARVFQRKFDDFGNHRNWTHDHIEFKHPWVFHFDADERFTPDLRKTCVEAVAEDRFSGFFVPNRIIFLGKWIRHCTRYPYHQVIVNEPLSA